MGLRAWFKPRPGVEAGRRLYARVVEQARTPALYQAYGAPDTPLGRFELYSLHAALLVLRLKGRGAGLAEVSQALFDAYVEGLDIALREMGVGDLSMGKKMKKLGRAFYGRVGSWETALASSDLGEAEALAARTVYEGVEGGKPADLAAYASRVAQALAGQADSDLAQGEITWPTP